jgi:hypothetical protein
LQNCTELPPRLIAFTAVMKFVADVLANGNSDAPIVFDKLISERTIPGRYDLG